MSNNDQRIKDLLLAIDKKKKEMGVKPRASWKSNGLIKVGDGHVNLNTLNTLSACCSVAACLIRETLSLKEASEFLDVECPKPNEDYLEDLKSKVSILKWDAEKKKLDVMESKLKDLRSGDAKTADAISEIAGLI